VLLYIWGIGNGKMDRVGNESWIGRGYNVFEILSDGATLLEFGGL